MAILASIKSLLIPNKNNPDAAQPGYQTDMQTLEIWARQPIQQLVAGTNITLTPASGLATDSKGNGPNPVTISATGGGGSFYASLTGAGETVTPGALTQLGNFTVTGQTQMYQAPGAGFLYVVQGGSSSGLIVLAPTTITGAPELVLDGSGNLAALTAQTGDASVTGTTGSIWGTTLTVIGTGGTILRFFAGTGALRQTVTGSRGGNVALANLLTALDTYGLIADGTTP